MKELKSYISEGFFSNVGANNPIKRVIDTIKDASLNGLNNKINLRGKRRGFIDLLTPILKDVETLVKKGKFVFEYTKNDETCRNNTIIISLEIFGLNDVRWRYIDQSSGGPNSFGWEAHDIALFIADDLYYETVCPAQDPKFHHSISKTIKITEFKIS